MAPSSTLHHASGPEQRVWTTYPSPIGPIALAATQRGLCFVLLEGEQEGLTVPSANPQDHPILEQTCRWLEMYFQGQDPGALPPLDVTGTPFQHQVWGLLQKIPYGTTTTYGALARELAHLRGMDRMSAQAVGQAVGRNPISILVPCHRVLGADGTLVGYASGLEKKAALLELEGISWTQKRPGTTGPK